GARWAPARAPKTAAPPRRRRRRSLLLRMPRPTSGGRASLPAVMSEGLVGLRHLVRVLALLHRVAAVVRRVDQLRGQLLVHGLLAALLGVVDDPAHGQGDPAVLPHFHGHLVGGAAPPAAL